MADEKKFAKQDMNVCAFTGNIGKVKELHYFENGNAVLNFSIAVSDDYTKDNGEVVKQTYWLDVSCYGKHAEGLSKVIKRWKSVSLTGKFKGGKSYEGQNGTGVTNKIDLINIYVGQWKEDQDEQEEDIEF